MKTTDTNIEKMIHLRTYAGDYHFTKFDGERKGKIFVTKSKRQFKIAECVKRTPSTLKLVEDYKELSAKSDDALYKIIAKIRGDVK